MWVKEAVYCVRTCLLTCHNPYISLLKGDLPAVDCLLCFVPIPSHFMFHVHVMSVTTAWLWPNPWHRDDGLPSRCLPRFYIHTVRKFPAHLRAPHPATNCFVLPRLASYSVYVRIVVSTSLFSIFDSPSFYRQAVSRAATVTIPIVATFLSSPVLCNCTLVL